MPFRSQSHRFWAGLLDGTNRALPFMDPTALIPHMGTRGLWTVVPQDPITNQNRHPSETDQGIHNSDRLVHHRRASGPHDRKYRAFHHLLSSQKLSQLAGIDLPKCAKSPVVQCGDE